MFLFVRSDSLCKIVELNGVQWKLWTKACYVANIEVLHFTRGPQNTMARQLQIAISWFLISFILFARSASVQFCSLFH